MPDFKFLEIYQDRSDNVQDEIPMTAI